jgi:transposase-like protein
VLAPELGLRRNQLHKWQRQAELKGEAAFSGQGRRAPLSDVEALQRRVARLEQENAILKKGLRRTLPSKPSEVLLYF